MHTVIPAVIPQSLDHLREALMTAGAFTNEVQVDIVDGHFVPFTSWPYRGSGSVMLLREYTEDFLIEVDLMIETPEIAVPLYVDAGVGKVVIHLESVTDLEAIREHQRTHEYVLGLSILNDTPLERLTDVLQSGDYVQLMGIRDIGTQGQPFDTRVLERIHILRANYPDLLISIDGSVNAETLPRLKTAGANRFVSGSAIFGAADPSAAYQTMCAL